MVEIPDAPEVSPLQLAAALESGDPVQVVDVRLPAQVAAGCIGVVPPHRFHNIVGSRLLAHASLEGTGIDPRIPVTVVCGQGSDSRVLALHLGRLGCRASSLGGGMAAWMMLVIGRELEVPRGGPERVRAGRPMTAATGRASP
jgi:rhodanese-related sulfurtransferase